MGRMSPSHPRDTDPPGDADDPASAAIHGLNAAGATELEPAWDEISFEELGQAYAEALAEAGGELPPPAGGPAASDEAAESLLDNAGEAAVWDAAAAAAALVTESESDDSDSEPPPTPLAIVEAALFIGTPENRALSEQELAGLMRDVTVADIQQYVARLNESYIANGQALRIYSDADGLRMSISPDMERVRRSFYGKIRETRLSQHAIEVLSLVAYQPGITADRVQQQRGKESLSLLNQLVRRRLLEQQRTVVQGSKKPLVTYRASERFLQLFGLDSLDDLPQVDG